MSVAAAVRRTGDSKAPARSGRAAVARRVLKENGLSIVLALMFLASLIPMSIAGYRRFGEEQKQHGKTTLSYPRYLLSYDFFEATLENCESEFLEMSAYVLLTVFLFQKGSSESKKLGEPHESDREPMKKKGAPWPVLAGGIVLKLYEHSLFLAFFLLFLIAFSLHAVSGTGDYNRLQADHGGEPLSVAQYVCSSSFWFESLQNWQSEFLGLFSMVVLSIYLRQKGSPESKPVDSPHTATEA